MGLLTPLGLLGLIGIPILVIIYIIKPKYHEKKISSTFVWKLSLKYRKRKIPLQWLQRSLLFFVQVLIIALTAMLLARPLMKVSAKDGEKVVILDVSASMCSEKNGTTRLDRAIDKLAELANDVNEENKLTIILADSTPDYLTRRETSASYAKFLLSTVNSTYEECNFDEALKLANTVIDENPAAEVFFYTDCQYEKTGYVNVVDFSSGEWNVGILDFTPVVESNYYNFKAKIGNYGKSTNLKLRLQLDDGKVVDEKNLKFAKDEVKDVVWDELNITTYTNAKLTISYLNSANKYVPLDDALTLDNEFSVQNLDNIKFDVQLISQSEKFIGSVLRSFRNVNVTAPKTMGEIKNNGQDLYVYDGYVPQTLPTDGAVWIVNPTSLPASLGLQLGNIQYGDWILSSTSNNSAARNKIMNLVTPSAIEATKYINIVDYGNFDVLMTCNGAPVLLAGMNGNAKVIILALDLHYSNLPITLNMAVLFGNMFDYCVNSTLEKNVYLVGENIVLNTQPSTNQLRVNNTLYMDDSNFQTEVNFIAKEPGSYVVEQKMGNTTEKDQFYVRISENETNYKYTRDVLAVDQYVNIETGVVGNPGGDAFDLEEASKYFAAALLALVIIEWGLQYREQY